MSLIWRFSCERVMPNALTPSVIILGMDVGKQEGEPQIGHPACKSYFSSEKRSGKCVGNISEEMLLSFSKHKRKGGRNTFSLPRFC